MGARLLSHIRGNVVAYLALGIALGGTSYAAITVTGAQVEDESLTGADIRDGSIKPADLVAAAGLSASSVRAKPALRGKRGPRGKQGTKGPQGSQGPLGLQGPPGPVTGPAGGDLAGSFPNPTLAPMPVARVRSSAPQVVNDNTLTYVQFGEEIADNAGMFDLTEPTRLTIQRTGTYVITANVHWAAESKGYRRVFLTGYGGADIGASSVQAVSGNPTRQNVSAVLPQEAGDVIQVLVDQTSGGSLNLEPAAQQTSLAAAWIGP